MVQLVFASEKNLCGIMKMVNLSHDCAPRHRKESGSQESCRFEKFRGDRFPGITGRGHPESFLYVSTATRAVASEGSPPILRAAELDDCAALVQYMADHCSGHVIPVYGACCCVFVLVWCAGSQDDFIKLSVILRTTMLPVSSCW
jgi:hypothetical protein